MAEMDTVMRNQQALAEHLAAGRFRAGVARGRWRLIKTQWPFAFIEVIDRNGHWVCIRLECSGYPERPPQGTPWNVELDQQLSGDKWPRGGRVSQVFNPGWKNGTALYIPCDRESIIGHDNWYRELPHLIWNSAKGIIHYIEAIHEVLQSHELQHQSA
jgi:hypothetical protein